MPSCAPGKYLTSQLCRYNYDTQALELSRKSNKRGRWKVTDIRHLDDLKISKQINKPSVTSFVKECYLAKVNII